MRKANPGYAESTLSCLGILGQHKYGSACWPGTSRQTRPLPDNFNPDEAAAEVTQFGSLVLAATIGRCAQWAQEFHDAAVSIPHDDPKYEEYVAGRLGAVEQLVRDIDNECPCTGQPAASMPEPAEPLYVQNDGKCYHPQDKPSQFGWEAMHLLEELARANGHIYSRNEPTGESRCLCGQIWSQKDLVRRDHAYEQGCYSLARMGNRPQAWGTGMYDLYFTWEGTWGELINTLDEMNQTSAQ